MDFENSKKFSFTKEAIEALTPGQIGVYGIYHSKAWVYIGRGDIRTELLRYVRGENPRITQEEPTSFCAIVTSDDEELEHALIEKYQPIANQKR